MQQVHRCNGIDSYTTGHIRWLHEAGMGEIDDIEIVGGGIDAVYQKCDLEAE